MSAARRAARLVASLLLVTPLAACAGRGARPSPDAGASRPSPGSRNAPVALVLDGTLADPAAHRALLARLAAAGLDPVYRRFDPRLGEADLARYRVVLWLAGGVRGSQGGLALGGQEVERAVRFVRGGGRLVLGVPPGAGAHGAEGRAFEAVLARLGIPIAFTPHEVVDLDPRTSYPAALVRAPLFVPDAAHPATRGLPARIVGARSAPLTVGPGATPLLWTHETAFLDDFYGQPPDDPAATGRRVVAAAGRAGPGGVLVASRDLLDAGGTLGRADFEPIVPERLPPGALEGRERFLLAVLRDLLGPLAAGGGPARAAAPPEVRALAAARRAACAGLRPDEAWIDREGLRIGWGYVDRADAPTAALLARLPATGVNALWGPADSWLGLAWPERDPGRGVGARRWLARIEEGLGGTPVRWLAGVNVPGLDADLSRYPKAVTIGGREVALPSPVDVRFWEEQVVPQVVALAAEAGRVAPLAGVILDLEMYGQPLLYWGDAFDFGDGPFRAFLADPASGAGGAAARAAARLAAAARGDWLLEAGRLPAYYAWLERQAEGIGRRLREALERGAPGRDLVLGFYAVSVLPSWFYRGLWRGASAGGRPVLLLTFQTDVSADLAEEAARGACLRHALAALLGLVGADGLAPALARAGRTHDGFWLNRVTTLVEPDAGYEAVETPAALRGDPAWDWLRAGVDAYLRARAHPD